MRWATTAASWSLVLALACSTPQPSLLARSTSGGNTAAATSSTNGVGGISTSSGTSASSSTSGGSSGSSTSGSTSGSSSGSSTTGGISCALADGGLFGPPLTLNANAGPNNGDAVNFPVAVGDFDYDGNLDIALAQLEFGQVGIFFGNGAGHFDPIVQYPNTFSSPVVLLAASFGVCHKPRSLS